MPQVDPVILALKAEVDQYQADLTKAQRHSDAKLDAIEKRGFQMGQKVKAGFSMMTAAAAAFAASAAVNTVMQAIKSGLDYASALGEVAQQVGVTTDALQFYRFAAGQSGLATEEMDNALAQLTRRAGEAANGTKAQAEAFEKLGISVKDANGNMIPTGDLIPKIAEGLKGLQSPAERAAVLVDLFGKSGQKLEPMLTGGAKGVNDLADSYRKMGTALTPEQIKNADEAADAIGKLQQRLRERIAGIVGDNSAAIIEFANNLNDLADKAERAFKALQSLANTPLGKLGGKAIGYAYEYNPIGLSLKGLNQGAELYMPSGGGGGRAPLPGKKTAKQNLWTGARVGVPSAIARTNRMSEGGDDLFAGALGGKPLLDIGQATASVAKLTGDLERLSVDLALAEADLTGNVRQRAEAEKRRIDYDAAQEVDRINASDMLNKAEAIAYQQKIATARKALVDSRAAEDVARQSAEAGAERFRFELDALEAERDAAGHLGERNAIEQRILELQQQEETARLEAAIAAGQIADAAQARAQLSRKQAAERSGLARGQQGPGAAYLDSLRMDAAELNAAYEDVAASGLRSLNDGLTEAIMGSRSLGDVFKNVANQIVADLIRIAVQQAIVRPIAESLFGGGGGGGGGLFGSIGSVIGAATGLFGRAGGGYVAPGQVYRVNEAASAGRVEAFMSRDGGTIIPLGQMNAPVGGGGGTVVQHFHLDARGAVMTQDIVNQINSMGQRAAEAGARGGHALASRDIAQMRRPKL